MPFSYSKELFFYEKKSLENSSTDMSGTYYYFYLSIIFRQRKYALGKQFKEVRGLYRIEVSSRTAFAGVLYMFNKYSYVVKFSVFSVFYSDNS